MTAPDRSKRQRMLDVLRASTVSLPSSTIATRAGLSPRDVNREISKCRRLKIIFGLKLPGHPTKWAMHPQAPVMKRGMLSGVDDRVTAEKLQWLRALKERPMFRDAAQLEAIIADYARALGVSP